MTVRFSTRPVAALVTLSVAVAIWLPVTVPREFDRTARSARGSLQRPGSWAGPCHGEDHEELAAVIGSEGPGISSAGRRRTAGQAFESAATWLSAPEATTLVRVAAGPRRLASRGIPAPTGRAPPLA
ncbi:MAG: hypothetical protein AB7Q16_18040 [Vicinamibacterales bacterium]